jgi:hypothetical protein
MWEIVSQICRDCGFQGDECDRLIAGKARLRIFMVTCADAFTDEKKTPGSIGRVDMEHE